MTGDSYGEKLIARIRNREARVGVIGLGYVGLPLALLFEEKGFRVIGFDIDPEKTERLNRGESYIRYIGSHRVARAFGKGTIEATNDFGRLADCDAVLICVPTPLGSHREPDLSYVESTAERIAGSIRPGCLVVLESTTYPGTTREIVKPILERNGLRAGTEIFIAFSPEREDPGNSEFDTASIPKVVGGYDPLSLEVARELYGAVVDEVVAVGSLEVAEASKLLENIFRAVNIALVNELKIVFDRMGIDIWEVIEAAKTKPFGYMPFYPGPGIGGHCIPLDPFYLSWKAAEKGVWARFIELAGEVNNAMPRYVIEATTRALNEHGKSVRGSRILVLGLSYKPDIDDDRESPSFELIEFLRELGADVQYCDPFIPRARPVRKHDIGLESVPCTPEELGSYDAVILSTAHSAFSDPDLYREARLIVDCRNAVPASVDRSRVRKA